MLVALVVAAAVAPGGAEASSSFISAVDCHEHQAFVAGDDAAVAARLPDGYTPLRTASGAPLVFARGLRCREATLDGRAGPLLAASYGVVVESPDGRGCGSGAPGAGAVKGDQPPICNWYVLRWFANDGRVVDWLRAGTRAFPAVHAPGMTFEPGEPDPAQGGAPFRFRAPGAFGIDSVARERPGEIAVRGGYWADTPRGVVKLALSSDDLSAGDASGVVTAEPGSELAALMGAEQRPYEADYSGFSVVRARHASYRKQVIGPAPRTTSFAGSCSFQGDVTFDPPASNIPTPLTYAYDARGTCSGMLDGREIADAPVAMYQSGPADGACTRAATTAPGQGTLTFGSGEVISYTLDFTSVGTEVDGTIYGERSGTATGHASFATQRTPSDVSLQCARGEARVVPMDLSMTTQSPLVSQRPAVARPRLRLAVTPRAARAGRRTAFRFRVTDARRRPVAGALVRFAGRRLRTGPRGRARVALAVRRPGRRVARARKPGFRAARSVVRVRRR
jgi:hypothetical protein